MGSVEGTSGIGGEGDACRGEEKERVKGGTAKSSSKSSGSGSVDMVECLRCREVRSLEEGT